MLEHEPDWPRVLPWRDDGLLNSKRGGNALTAPSSFHIHVHSPNSRHPLILMSASQTFYTLNIYGVLEAIYHCHSSTTSVQDKGYSSYSYSEGVSVGCPHVVLTVLMCNVFCIPPLPI